MDIKRQKEVYLNLMKCGYFFETNTYLWTGFVRPTHKDYQVEKLLPLGKQVLRVMPEKWVHDTALYKGGIYNSFAYKISISIKFESGRQRFVFEKAAPLVAESVDYSSKNIKRYYKKMIDKHDVYKTDAIRSLSYHADTIWKMINSQKESKSYPDKAPEAWRKKYIQSVIDNHFPSKEKLAHMGITYSFFKTINAPIIGEHQKPHPGLVVDTSPLLKKLSSYPKDVKDKLHKRIKNFMASKVAKTGLYALGLRHLKRDFQVYEAMNPVPYKGKDQVTALFSEISSDIEKIDNKMFCANESMRKDLSMKCLNLLKLMTPEWEEAREEAHKKYFAL